MSDKTVCVDFDGVIYPNFKYHGVADLRGAPVDGAVDALAQLAEAYRVVIYSARCSDPDAVVAMATWLAQYGMTYEVCTEKPRAHIYIDDRAVRFDGSWARALEDVGRFKQWQADDKLRARIQIKRRRRRG